MSERNTSDYTNEIPDNLPDAFVAEGMNLILGGYKLFEGENLSLDDMELKWAIFKGSEDNPYWNTGELNDLSYQEFIDMVRKEKERISPKDLKELDDVWGDYQDYHQVGSHIDGELWEGFLATSLPAEFMKNEKLKKMSWDDFLKMKKQVAEKAKQDKAERDYHILTEEAKGALLTTSERQGITAENVKEVIGGKSDFEQVEKRKGGKIEISYGSLWS